MLLTELSILVIIQLKHCPVLPSLNKVNYYHKITMERDTSKHKEIIRKLKPRASKGYPKLKSNILFVCLFFIDKYLSRGIQFSRATVFVAVPL